MELLNGGPACEQATPASFDGLAPSVVITVSGMMCQRNCATTVQQSLLQVEGVQHAEVSFASGLAKVWGSAHIPDLVSAVEMVGYEALAVVTAPSIPASTSSDGPSAVQAPDYTLAIVGMMCQRNCATTVHNALLTVPGVGRAVVTFETGLADVYLRDRNSPLDPAALVDCVEMVGFEASLVPSSSSSSSSHGSGKSILATTPPSPSKSNKIPTTSHTVPSHTIPAIPSHRKQAATSPPPTSSPAKNRGGGVGVGVASSFLECKIGGMSCAACVRNVESALNRLAGVVTVKIALLAAKAEVTFDASQVTQGDIQYYKAA